MICVNSLIKHIAFLAMPSLFLCPQILAEAPMEQPVGFGNFDKSKIINISSITRLWDGGSILIECNSKSGRFYVLLQRPKEADRPSVNVYVFDDPAKPNSKFKIVEESLEEKKLVQILTVYFSVDKALKFRSDIRTAVKYIINRKLLWDDNIWILPK